MIEGLRPKLHGWCRYILHKNILRPNFINMDGPEDKVESRDQEESGVCRNEIKIQISDIEGQFDLLKRGFKGFKIAFLSEGAEVFYAKF